ncbi:MAG: molybdenum cofactor biosynthesis protein MoaE [Actinomycetota bacterium]|nr:molybdenum cofactor biosynthesis protein MoaE [Actinomycetota bacterium]
MVDPAGGEDWVGLRGEPLAVEEALAWIRRPECGASVVFFGSVRDHSEGRPAVSQLAYEAYTEQVEQRLADLAAGARRQWPELGRIVLWHRVGVLSVEDLTVVVAVSAPHRDEAFVAARWCIDTLKSTVPVWKHEVWAGGEDWGLDAHPVTEVGS